MLRTIKAIFAPSPAEPTVVPAGVSHPVMRSEPVSSFLWLDRPGAVREIRRRQSRGEITADEAEGLRHWAEHGYVVLERCIPADLIDTALADLDRFWAERRPLSIDVLTTGERTTIDAVPPETRRVPVKVNDLYLHSEAVRKIFLHERIVRFAELVFGDRVVGCNSLTFEYSTQQPAHVDHIYMTPTPARRLLASWVACEDIAPDAGPLTLWSGSHRLAPYDFGETAYHFTPDLDADHTAYIGTQKERFPRTHFVGRKGDVLLWHGMLIHAGSPIEREGATRKSMAFHYFSRECVGERTDGVAREGRALYLTKDV
jgi:ectoine hydroxylase-related dioxygenase (phytanoyl-CoA dioxygenase family)